MKNITKTKKMTILSLYIAIGLVLQYIEGKLSISAVPGGKLGLCNVISIINIFMFGGKSAISIAVVRSILGSFLFGGALTVPYSLSGAFFSTLSMWVLKHLCYPKISIVGMSIVGAAVHNLSQVAAASLMYRSIYVFSYLPVLLVTATVSGFLTGCAAYIFISRTKGTIL